MYFDALLFSFCVLAAAAKDIIVGKYQVLHICFGVLFLLYESGEVSKKGGQG